jgi:hypothetical protein
LAAQLFYLPFQAAVKPTNVGAPGAQAYFFQPGSTTLAPIFASSALTTQLSNPVIADGAGHFADIYLDGATTYKLVIYDKNGSLLYQKDPYIPGSFVIDLTGTAITPQAFGAVGDDTTNDGPAFAAAIAYLKTLQITATYGLGSPRLFIPKSKYYLGTTTLDITHGLIIEGESLGEAGGEGTQLRWAAGATGFRVQRYNTVGSVSTYAGVANTNAGDAVIIRNLMLKGGYAASSADFYAIHLRARATLRDLYIENWQGDGIYANCTGGSGGASEGNANNIEMTRLFITGCRNGVYLTGADVNAGVGTSVSCVGNRVWGIQDLSFLGNTWVACHTAANVTGPYKTSNANACSVFIGCYSESDQPASSFAASTLVLGGLHGAGMGSFGGWLKVVSSSLNTVADLNVSQNLTVTGSAVFGPETGAVDGSIYVDGSANHSFIYGRKWAAGSATTVGFIDFNSIVNTVDINASIASGYIRLQYQGADVATVTSAGLDIQSGKALKYAGANVLAAGVLTAAAFPALTGDITTSAGSLTTAIGANKVTLGMLAQLATVSLIGNATGGSATPTAITLAGGLSFSGTTISPTGGALAPASVAATAAITSSSATAGIGYATGAGGTVTQITSRTTAPPAINKVCGSITLVSAAGSTAWQTFTVSNSTVAATDSIRVVQKSGTDKYMIHVTAVGAGTFDISFATTGGTTTEQPVFNFAVLKAVAA